MDALFRRRWRPASTATRRTAFHLDALYALAYLHSQDDETARQAVAGAIGTVRRDLVGGASIAGLAGSTGLWRALADELHVGYTPGPAGEGDVQVDAGPALWVPCAARPSPCTSEADRQPRRRPSRPAPPGGRPAAPGPLTATSSRGRTTPAA